MPDEFLAEPQPVAFTHESVALGAGDLYATRWKALWLPYVTAKGGKQLPLERPDQQVLANLFADIERTPCLGVDRFNWTPVFLTPLAREFIQGKSLSFSTL